MKSAYDNKNKEMFELLLFSPRIRVGVKSIANSKKFVYIEVPSYVTILKSYLFDGCTNLKIVKFKDPSPLASISEGVFQNCSNLEEIPIPSSIKSIGRKAFFGCSSLTKIDIPTTVEYIGTGAFSNCYYLTNITIPSLVSLINDNTFNECSSLTELVIPSLVISIGKRAFYKCTSLNELTIPSSVKSIGEGAFFGCSSLTELAIPSSVTSIQNDVFNECTSLKTVSIPSSLSSIGNNAFKNCSSINHLLLPSSLSLIGKGAFYECSSLTELIIPSSITSIENDVCNGCSSLKQISIPSSITKIGDRAFYECSSLLKIQIPSSVTSIGEDAFFGCSSLTELIIPSSITSIEKDTFNECSSLKQISIPSSVTIIGNRAFRSCSSLEQIQIPSSVTWIGEGVFCNCSLLKEVLIPPLVTSINDHTFYGCSFFAQNGSLMSILEMEKSGNIHNLLDDTKKLINFFGIASAMKYFHSKNIFFGFLFLDDILEDCYLYPKLINFSRTKDLNSDPWKSMIKDPMYYKKNDVFAFGIILYNFFSNDIYDVYTFTQFLPVFNSMIPKFYKDLIKRCIDTDFENRPTFSEIVELLKTEEALTDKVNKKEFLNYINFIESGNKFLLKNISQIILNEEKEKEEIQYENNNNDFKVNPKFLLSLENYRILEVIGSGGFSHVFKIQNKISNEFYVAKISSAKIDDESDEIKLYTCREINILSELNHPALIKFLGFSKNDFEGNPCPTILMEYASNGSLDGMFKLVNSGLAPNEWTETKKLINIYGIASGMKYLHSLDIIHRDLKPANILLDDYLFPKLCDFGLSKDLNTNNHSQQGMKGTPLYMAPECLINEIYSKKSDVYSFAFIVYQFFSLEIPNQHKNIIQYFKMIERGERPRFDFDIPEFYKDLIERCWDQNPDFRPTFSQIVDLLESDDALTDTIDEIEFMNYVDFIKSNVFPPNKTNINDYVSYDKCPNSKIVNDFTFLQKLKFGTFTNLPVFKTFNKVKVNYDVIKKAKDIIISASIPKIDLDKYQREDYLGYGGFAKVYKITNKETKDIYAAKILNNETQDLDDEERLSVLREVTILPKMKYESIIKFIGYSLVNFQKVERPVFVTELAVNGSLGNVLQLERKGWTITGWNDTKKLINIYGIACGMEYLHYNTIIHRDLKPGNVLLNENLYPKITDFGFSRPFKHNCDQISEHASTVLGTLPYISPEIWDCYDHSSASDVYAFAMVVYEIITKEEPLKNFTNSFQIRNEVLRNQYRPTFENPIPNCYKKLIESCWCKDKLKRPTFTEIVYELKTNKEFITENIDMDEFVSYTKLLGEPYPLNKKDKLKLKKNMAKKEKKKIYIPSTIKEISELTISTFNRIIDTSKNEPLFGNCFLDLDQFEQIKLIMKNDLSKIFEVVKKDTRKKYSARVSNIDMNQFTENEMIAIANEMKSISRISHPCILQFVGFSPKSFKNEPKPVIVNKLIKTKTLKEILSTVQQKGFVAGFDSTTKLKIIYGIASAIDRLHNDDILHRNLTPSNILLTKSFNPKISEFGLCTHLLIKSSVTFQSTRQFNGSPTYSAPEILNSSENTKKSDVYSFGLIVYEILTGEKPFNKIKSFSQFYEAVMRGYRPEFPDDMPEIYKRFIEYCWCQNPDERPQFVDIMNILKSDNAFFTDDINKSSFFKYVRKIDNYKDPDHHSSKHHKKNTL